MSYEIINENFFCVRHKNRRKRNQHFKLLFFTINLHFVISNKTFAYRKLSLPLTSSTSLDFLPLKMQKRLKQTQSLRHVSLLCLKRNNPQTFKCGSCSVAPFSPACMSLVQLVSINVFILCDNWKTLLFIKVNRYSEIF